MVGVIFCGLSHILKDDLNLLNEWILVFFKSTPSQTRATSGLIPGPYPISSDDNSTVDIYADDTTLSLSVKCKIQWDHATKPFPGEETWKIVIQQIVERKQNDSQHSSKRPRQLLLLGLSTMEVKNIYLILNLPCNLPQINVLKVFHIFWEAIKLFNLVVTEM